MRGGSFPLDSQASAANTDRRFPRDGGDSFSVDVSPSDISRHDVVREGVMVTSDLPPEKWTPGYATFASACSGVM